MKFRKDTSEKMKRLRNFLCTILGQEEGDKRYKSYCRKSSEKMLIFKHGEVIGKQKYQEVIKNVSFSRTKDAYIQKYGEAEGTRRWKEKNSKLSVSIESLRKNGYTDEQISHIKSTHATKSKHTRENFIERYGFEDGMDKYTEWLSGSKNRSCRSVEGTMIRLGMDEHAAKEYVRSKQARGLDYFIRRYGPVDGEIRYLEYNKKRLSYPNAVSKPQKELCMWLHATLVGRKVEGVPVTQQPTIRFSDGSWIFPDIVIDNKIVVEFNGEYWHSLPEVVEKDKIKYQKLSCADYKLIVVWYNDYINDKEQTQKYLLEKIYENKSN